VPAFADEPIEWTNAVILCGLKDDRSARLILIVPPPGPGGRHGPRALAARCAPRVGVRAPAGRLAARERERFAHGGGPGRDAADHPPGPVGCGGAVMRRLLCRCEHPRDPHERHYSGSMSCTVPGCQCAWFQPGLRRRINYLLGMH
jgi:hypothetical protein